MKKDFNRIGATLCSSMRPRSSTTSCLNKFKLLALVLTTMLSINVWGGDWTRVTTIKELTDGGTFIMGYEATAKSGIIVPLRSKDCNATTSANGYFNTGITAGSSTNGTIDMSKVTETADYEVYITSPASGKINIQMKDAEGNFYGATSGGSTKNSGRLYTSGNSTETNLTPEFSSETNNQFKLTGAVTGQYKYLKYNTSSPRFAFYNSAGSNIVFYKKASSKKTVYLKNTMNWPSAYAYYYTGSYWDATNGSGSASGGSFKAGGEELTYDNETGLFKVTTSNTDYKYVVFTKDKQDNYGNFYNTEAIYCNNNFQYDKVVVVASQTNETKNGTKYYSDPNLAAPQYLDVTDGEGTGFFLPGGFNSWETKGNEMTLVGGTLTYTKDLAANTTYEFKVYNKGKYYGWGNTSGSYHTFTASGSKDVYDGNNNLKIQTSIAGTYTFTFNSSNNTVTVTYPAPPVTVTFKNNGETLATGGTRQVPSGQAIGTLPVLTSSDACDYASRTFVGWTATEIMTKTDVEPTLISASTVVSADITYHAVWAEGTTSTFDAATLENLTEDDEYWVWTENTTGVEMGISAGQRYTSGSPYTFTITKGTTNYFYVEHATAKINTLTVTLSGTDYKIGSVSNGTLTTNGTTQTVTGINATQVNCYATSSQQIRATKIVATTATNYITKCATAATIKTYDGSTLLQTLTDQTLNVAVTPTAPSAKTGYDFVGWNEDQSASSGSLNFTPTQAKEYTLYAIWQVHKHTLTYANTEGATIGNGTAAGQVAYGTALTTPTNVTKPGYDFAGWSANLPATMPDNDVTITASWNPHTYTATVNQDGGTGITAMTVTYLDNKLVITGTSTKNEFKLTGYLISSTPIADKDGNLLPNVSGYTNANGEWIGTSNPTIKVEWTAITWTDYLTDCGEPDTWKIWYKVKDADDNTAQLIDITETGSHTFTSLPKETTYEFKIVKYVGGESTNSVWYTNVNGGSDAGTMIETNCTNWPFSVEGGTGNNTRFLTAASGDYTMTVVTTGASPSVSITYPASYTVTFAGNGNDGGSMTNVIHIAAGENVTLADNAYTKTGNHFKGWVANVAVTIGGSSVPAETLIADGATIQNINSNIILTAQWETRVTALTISQESGIYEIVAGETLQLTLTVTPNNAEYGTDYTWHSSNTSTMTVDQDGLVTGVQANTGDYIYVTNNDGVESNHYGITVKSAACDTWGLHMWNTGGTFRDFCFSQVGSTTEWRTQQVTLPSNSDDEKLKVLYAGRDGDHSAQWTTRWVPTVGYQQGGCHDDNDGNICYAGQDAKGYFRIFSNSVDPNYFLAFQPVYAVIYGVEGQTWQQVEFTDTETANNFYTDIITVPEGYNSNVKIYAGTSKASGVNSIYGRSSTVNMNTITGLTGSGMAGKAGKFKINDNYCNESNFNLSFIRYYRLHYNLDGGEGTGDYTDKFALPTAGDAERTFALETAPTKEGYTFRGWSVSIGGGAAIIKEVGDDVTLTEDAVVTAIWAQNFTVTYDLEGYSTSCSSSTVHYCGETGIVVCEDPEDKTGYTFMGWNTDDITGSAADYQPGATFTMPCNNVVFTAHYQAVPYTITYNGLEGASNTNPATYTIESNITFVAPGTRTGYTFTGWTENGNPITGIAAGTTGTKTITANWSLNSHNVIFDANGHGTAPAGYIGISYGATITEPTAPDDVEEDGNIYSFIGWYKENTCTNVWNFATDVMPDNDLTLYAKWSGVTYEDYRTHCCTPLDAPTGGVANDVHMTTATLSWGEVTGNNGYQVSADQASWENVLGGTSYNLTGLTAGTHYIYYVRAKGDNNEYCEFGTSAQIEFTTKAALHITYNANGGTGDNVVSGDIEEGTSATVADNTFGAPTGMTFNGWNTQAEGTGAPYAVGYEISSLNADLTLYAQWKGETYNITYNLNDGAWNGAAGAATYEFGTGIPTLATNVEKSGFRFDGWYSNEGLTEGPVTSIGADATGDKEFWAKWTAVYAITYTIPTGGGTLAPDAQTSAASGEPVKMPGLQGTVPSPYECETLIGWTTSSTPYESETGAMPDPFYAVGANYPAISGATTFYAVYSRAGQGASGTISLTNDEISENWGTSAGASGYDVLKTITNTAGTWSSNGYAQNGNKFIQIKQGAYYLSIPEQPGNLTTITITHNTNSSERTVFLTSSTSTTPQLASQAIPAYQTTTEFDVSDANVKGGYLYINSYTLQIQSVTASYGAPNIISTGLNCSNDILEFTVTYDANSGQFTGAETTCTSPDTHTFNGDDPETNPYTICSDATCEGMTLIGWNSQADGQGGLSYTPGQVISSVSQEEITLYAQFAYNVNVKDNDSWQMGVHPSERGGTIDLDGGDDVCDPVKYEFIGWTTDNPATWKQTITSPNIFSSDKVTTYTPTAAGTQVTAVYGMSTSVGSQAFYISYNGNYLKFNGESVNHTTVEAEATAMYRETINASENQYHLYYMNSGVKTYFYYNNSDLAVSTSNPGQSYGWVITTDGAGVSTFQSMIASGRYLSYASSFTTHSSTYKRPLTITTGAKEYKYYDETTCTDEITITFNAGGGTMDPVTTQIVGHEGDVITVPTCSYPGWTFLGWVTTPAEAQSDIKIADENIYTNEDGHEYEIGSQNETLYAYYTRTPVPPVFDGNISDVWKIYVPVVVGAEYVYHYEVGAKNISDASAHGEYTTTTRCIEATDWAFTNVGTNQFTIQNPKGLYLNGDPNGDENDIYFRATPSVWTMEAKTNGFYKFVNENTPTRYLAFQINNGAPTFVNTSTHNETNPAYSYVKVGGCTDPVYTTSPGGEFTLNMLGNVRVTSTSGKTVRSVDALSISADNLTPNTAITLSADPAVLTFCDATGAALSLTTDANGKLANTAVYVKYAPMAYNTTETPTITATCGERHQDFAGLVTGRSLPEKFIIAQKVGDDWYALPNDMTNSQTNPAAVKLLSVNEATGTATIYSDVENYLAWTMDVTGQEANKNTLEFVSALTGYLKVAETDANTIGQYAKQSGVKQNYTEFLPATTDLIDYTLYNNAQTKYIGISNDVWGVYSDAATVRFLVIDQQPAVNLTLSGDVVLTSAYGIEVYGNQTSNLLHISANYTNVAKLRYTYNDGTSDVTVSNSVFRLNYYGFPDKTDYNKADATTANHKIDVNSLTGEVDQTFSVSLTPAAANTTYNYTLTIAALDASNNVMEEKQITLKGRSLPEQFVIAMKNTTDNKWYALPNDLATSTSGSSSTKAPLLISVDNTTTPTKALMAPKNTLYKGDSRYQPNSHRNAIRFLRADAESNAWITTSSTSLLYMPNNGADKQQFNLLSSDLSAYTITQDEDTKTITMYGGTIGWYDSGSNKTVYLLPVDASAEDAVFDIVEWFPTKLLIESSQAITTTSVQVGDDEAVVAAASMTTYGTHLYEVQTGDLTAKAGQAMSVSYTIEATTYAKVVTVPIILSRGTYATSGSVFGGLDAQAKYKENDLVVRDGATLTIDAATGTHNTFKNVTIYPTSKVIVPAKATSDDTKEVTMTTTTMTLFGGTDEIYNGSEYMLTKYGVPQLVLNGKLEHSETTSGLVYDVRLDAAQYYNFALPYTSKYELVTDNKGGEDFTFWTKIYDGETRAAGNNGWVWYDWDADPWAINIGTGYMFAAQPYSGQNYIIIRHPMGYYNAGEDKYAKNEGGHQSGTAEATKAAVDVYAYPSKYDNNAGWNYIANPFMANFTKDLDGEATGTIQTGRLVEHKVNDKWDGHYDWEAGSMTVRYVTLYNNGTDTYTQLPMSTAVLAPFTGFFVQIAENGQIVFDIEGRVDEAPARMLNEDELPSEMEIFLHAAGQGQKDETVLFLSNGLQRGNAKEFPNEMTKQENAGTLNFYTYGGETKMYANGMSYTDGQTWSNAGLMVAKEGSYTFSVTGADNEHVSHVILRDKYSNTEYDLKHTDAEIYLEAGEVNDRFDVKLVLDEHGVTTELDNVHDNNNPEKFIYNDKMFIRVNGRIYDATGKRVNK